MLTLTPVSSRTTRRVVAVTAATVLAAGGLATSAQADPKGSTVLDLTCEGTSRQVTLNDAKGPWVPAHDNDSTGVFIPVGFAGATFDVTVVSGPLAGQTFSTSEPDRWKKGNRVGAGIVECTFFTQGTFYEPDAQGEIQFVYSGTVYGKTAAR
jgi:hypothetical protein